VSLLQISRVTKRYSGVAAVNDVSLAIDRGSIVALIGPNGAGKSTFLGVVAGANAPDRGSIRFDGRETTGLGSPAVARAGIARTFQSVRLFGHLTARENVMMGCHTRAKAGLLDDLFGSPRHRAEERALGIEADRWLAFAGLSDVASVPAASLSIGQQRRVEFARALIMQPALLLLDEPASGLNTAETLAFAALMRESRALGITTLVVEHDMDLVAEVADHVVVLDFGSIIAEGAFRSVQDDPRVVEAYFGVAEIA
jgi:ABC-type branched-subunit amino acid transport system ATPase component